MEKYFNREFKFCPNNHETCLLSPLECYWVVFAFIFALPIPKASKLVHFYHLKKLDDIYLKVLKSGSTHLQLKNDYLVLNIKHIVYNQVKYIKLIFQALFQEQKRKP